jgi:hypothetical protein
MGRAAIQGVVTVAICALVILGFQNCAQSNSPPVSVASSSSTSSGGPIYSTYPSARFSTSTANTWQYSGESISFTVPPGSNQSYRISVREMAITTVAGQFLVTLSSSSTTIANVPQGLGIPYQTINADLWSTVSTEGYVNLPPGDYTYYLMIYNSTAGTLSLANQTSDNAAYCVIMAWPLE